MRALVLLFVCFIQTSISQHTTSKVNRFVVSKKSDPKNSKLGKPYDDSVKEAIMESHVTSPMEVRPLTEDDYNPPRQLIQQTWVPNTLPAAQYDRMYIHQNPMYPPPPMFALNMLNDLQKIVKKGKNKAKDMAATDLHLEQAILESHTPAPGEVKKLTEDDYNPPKTIEQYWTPGNDLVVTSVRRHPSGGVVPHTVLPAAHAAAAHASNLAGSLGSGLLPGLMNTYSGLINSVLSSQTRAVSSRYPGYMRYPPTIRRGIPAVYGFRNPGFPYVFY